MSDIPTLLREMETAEGTAAELGAQLTKLDAQTADLRTALANEQHDAGLGVVVARVEAEKLLATLSAGADKRAKLQAAADRAGQQIATLKVRIAEAKALQSRLSIPDLRIEHERQAELIQRLGENLGTEMNKMFRTGLKLAEALGTGDASRVFSAAALANRFRIALRDCFISVANDGSFSEFGTPAIMPHRWFDIPAPAVGDASRMNLPEMTRRLLDQNVALYASEAGARAAAARLDSTGQVAHVVHGPDGLWSLFRGKLRGIAAGRKIADAEGAP